MTPSLDQLTKAANALLAANEHVVKQTEVLKTCKEVARVLREETVPGMMQELAIKDLTLDSGQKLSMSQEVYASIPADRKDDAFTWLTENGHDGIIKTNVITTYVRGERDTALALQTELEERGLSAAFQEQVHPQTLKAFIKEQLREGNPIPLDTFGARPVMTARIK